MPFDYVSDEVYTAELFSFLVPAAEMKRYGYVVNPLSHTDIQYKAKCKNCNQCTYMIRYRTTMRQALLTL